MSSAYKDTLRKLNTKIIRRVFVFKFQCFFLKKKNQFLMTPQTAQNKNDTLFLFLSFYIFNTYNEMLTMDTIF